ncbi:hypothetical protein JAAARDRAFT_128181 [Jaapia argillacea MUCL 33604]|uniref:Peptidase S9 prolyl oligopeptidase catalytic domain-containing protein n=1 Tax=Jaapia argillacea MUCL 33604 TaxID=933084 RepID=A0A067Q9D9_9AGAM|nr:hypothetical protein JAAARDRAFT_128181 [Jaapia argillacea MUCL 33604]
MTTWVQDQRNHGNRLVTAKANNGWNETSDARDKNDHHALDMYSIQTGTASDVSFLIDFLPSYLYPMDEKDIACWVVAGVSLGGHASWIALKNDKRISAGIPIIGCPDYLALMSDRAAKSSVPFAPPYVPKSLLQLIHKKDPAYSPYTIADETNPYFGKKVLVLCGGKDKLVPWTFSQEFVEKLEVGTNGKKKAVVYPECGHECTQEMVDTMATFIWEEVVIQ